MTRSSFRSPAKSPEPRSLQNVQPPKATLPSRLCEGGGIYGLLARDRFDELIQFIIAYQIMCDYLDNLCDQSDYLDLSNQLTLH